jgi:predicted secreted protein
MSEVTGSGVAIAAREALGSGEYVLIACASSISFNYVNEIIGRTSVNSGSYREKRVRISDCRGSVSGVVLAENEPNRLSIFHFLQEGIRRSEIDLQFSWQDRHNNVVSISGRFIVSTIDLTSDISQFADFDLALEGTGAITMGEIEPPGDVVCDEFESDWWNLGEGESGISGNGVNGRSFAGKRVIEVSRTGYGGMEIIDSGIPGNAQALYSGGSTITFDPGNPFNEGEQVFVIWVEQEDES